MELIVHKIQLDGDRKLAPSLAKKFRLAAAYVSDSKRPFYNGDILGDFEWRRNHKQPAPHGQILLLVVKALRAEGITVDESKLDIIYSRKAGCSMCPCSPGFVIRTTDPELRWRKPFDIWIGEKEVQANASHG